MHHVLAILASIAWLSLNMLLWGWIKSAAGLFLVSVLLGVGYFAAFFWYASRKSG